MKNVKKLFKKAMVFTVAASMLVGTPLTASAAGIRGVYGVSDGAGNFTPDPLDPDDTATGTVTNTNTNTGVLSENETKIIGIALDQEYVRTEVGAVSKPTLKATVILDGTTDPEVVDAINDLIRWETSDRDKVSIDVKASDRTVATLTPKKAANVGEEVVITASIGGDHPFEYTYTDEETGKEVTKIIEGSQVQREKSAKVFVKEYANNLSFKKMEYDVLVKHTMDMKNELVKDPDTANDDITWSISSTTAATISDDGIVTVKKYDSRKPEKNTFTVTAVSEHGKKATATLTVGAGEPATKVEIYEKVAGADDVLLKGTKNVDAGGEEECDSIDVYAVMYAKKNTTTKNNEELKNGASYTPKDGTESVELQITDEITWSSNKTNIVKIAETDSSDDSAKLVPVNVGTAKITATATSGKKASFNVKVSATLNGLRVNMDTVPGTAYTGQSIILDVERDPEMNNDALKWTVWTDETYTTQSKDVTINSKGVLKVKNTLKTDKVYVKVESKKGAKIANTDVSDKNTLGPQTVKIELEQSSINGISITDITNVKDDKDAGVPVIHVYFKGENGKQLTTDKTNNAKTDIRIPVNGVYQATVELDGKQDQGDNESLSWTNSNSKVADMLVGEDGKVTIRPKAKGTTKITASGIKVTKWDPDNASAAKTAKVIKAQFTVNVIQPTTSVKLNKTDVVLYPKTGSNQKQSVSLKATMNPKGAADLINWTVTDKDGNALEAGVLTDKTKATGKNNVNFKVEFAAPALGDEYKVVATSVTGVSTTATIRVLQKPTSVEIHDPDTEHLKFNQPKDSGNGTIANTKYVEIGKRFDMCPEIKVGSDWIVAGTNNTEGVTYTQSGKGKVNIVGNTVYGVKEGKVTITAKTPNNKKTTLKVEVRPAK